jgi:hypothetical protein
VSYDTAVPPNDTGTYTVPPIVRRDHDEPLRRITVPTGTTTRTEHLYRAHLPDGRIRDTDPFDAPQATPFGRFHLPKATRIEHLTCEITVTADAWTPTAREVS